MRILKKRESLVILSMPEGDEVGVYFRQPKTTEIHGYNNESVQRKRNKVVFRHSQAQLKYGKMIITGLREGDFGIEKDGKEIPISSNPESPHHNKNWLELLEEYDPTVIIGLGAHVFGGTEALDGDEEKKADEPEDEPEDISQD